jgi:hypothetical protein
LDTVADYKYIQRTQPLKTLIKSTLQLASVTQIGLEGKDLSSSGCTQFIGRAKNQVAPTKDSSVGTCIEQRFGHRTAQSSAGPSNQCLTPREIE